MKLKVLRYSDNGDSTTGLLYVNDEFFCYTLEDEKRGLKVRGETRIPEGVYNIDFLKVLTPKTKQYRKRYDWFSWHLHVQDVPNFSHIYIHVGNTQDHTDGCLLVGEEVTNNQQGQGMVKHSRKAFKRLYKAVSQALNNSEQVSIEYVDIAA